MIENQEMISDKRIKTVEGCCSAHSPREAALVKRYSVYFDNIELEKKRMDLLVCKCGAGIEAAREIEIMGFNDEIVDKCKANGVAEREFQCDNCGEWYKLNLRYSVKPL